MPLSMVVVWWRTAADAQRPDATCQYVSAIPSFVHAAASFGCHCVWVIQVREHVIRPLHLSTYVRAAPAVDQDHGCTILIHLGSNVLCHRQVVGGRRVAGYGRAGEGLLTGEESHAADKIRCVSSGDAEA